MPRLFDGDFYPEGLAMKKQSCPISGKEVIDTYFIENRARLLDIAAFLDRIDRTRNPEVGKSDFRYKSFKRGLKILLESEGNRTKALQINFSDLSKEPRKSAAGLKGAYGAWEGPFSENH
jgi:hypothetical protein